MRAVATAGGFPVPLAVVILILNGFRVAGHFLLLGGRPRRGERLGMGGEAFGKHTIDLIGPAAVVLDNLVCDIMHRTPFTVVKRPLVPYPPSPPLTIIPARQP